MHSVVPQDLPSLAPHLRPTLNRMRAAATMLRPRDNAVLPEGVPYSQKHNASLTLVKTRPLSRASSTLLIASPSHTRQGHTHAYLTHRRAKAPEERFNYPQTTYHRMTWGMWAGELPLGAGRSPHGRRAVVRAQPLAPLLGRARGPWRFGRRRAQGRRAAGCSSEPHCRGSKTGRRPARCCRGGRCLPRRCSAACRRPPRPSRTRPAQHRVAGPRGAWTRHRLAGGGLARP